MKYCIYIILCLGLAACAKEKKEQAELTCEPLMINGVQAEGNHEFALNDVRWAKGYQCGQCEKFVAVDNGQEDLRCP